MRRYLPEQTWARATLGLLLVLALVFPFLESLEGSVRVVGSVGSALAFLVLGLVLPPILSRPGQRDQLRDVAARHVRGPVMQRVERPSVTSLLDPLYGISRFEGRSRDLAALNRFLHAPESPLMVVSGPPWSGKTRLVAHWAASVGPRWKAGWVIFGHGRQAVESAFATGDPTLLLVDGFGPDAGHVMDALQTTTAHSVRMVLVVDEHVDVTDVASRHSATAGHVAQSARTWLVTHLGGRSDHERWYPRMVRDYATAVGRPSAGLGVLQAGVQPDSIGMLNALALATVVRGRHVGINPVLTDLLKDLWQTQVRDWHAEATQPRWGLLGVSESQVDSAAVATLLGFDPSQEGAEDQLGKMPSWDGTGLDLRIKACGFLREAVWPQGPGTPPAIVMAHVLSWRDERRQALVTGVTSCGAATRNCFMRVVLAAAPMVKGTGAVLDQLIGDQPAVLEDAVTLIRERGRATSEVDKAIAQAIGRRAFTAEQLAFLEGAVPRHLGRARAEVGAARVRWHREHGTDSELADGLKRLAVLLHELGRDEEAVAIGEEAVGIFRRLLADPRNAHPETHTHKLAASLNNLIGMLSNLGRHQEALATGEDAVALFRQLVADPDTHTHPHYTRDLAGSLTNVASQLSDLKRHQEALEFSRESAGLFRQLANPDTGDPVAHDSELAASLNNLAGMLRHLGRPQEALDVLQEAVALYQQLADPDSNDSEVHTSVLAASLQNLAALLGELGLYRKALPPAEESVALCRQLANPDTGDPEAFTPDLARSLKNLANRFSDLGLHRKAFPFHQEAVALFRRLADPDTGKPQAYTFWLAGSLNDLAGVLVGVEQHEDAVATAEESVTLFRKVLADSNTVNSTSYTSGLALTLNNLASLLSDLGRDREALAPAQESVALYRWLADRDNGNDDIHTPGLTLSLDTLATIERALAQKGHDELGSA